MDREEVATITQVIMLCTLPFDFRTIDLVGMIIFAIDFHC